MNIRESVKPILQKGISPFLPNTKLQERFAILHEVLPEQEQALQNILSLIDTLPKTCVQLTFDDGFYSSYQAIKQLKNHKAIFFVCPEFINRAESGNWQDFFHNNLMRKEQLQDANFVKAVRPASWDNLRELVKLGHIIGSHGMSHQCLSKIISEKELEQEIIGSADLLEDKLQVKINHFSNPFGNIQSFDQRALKIAKKRYQYFFTGIRGNNFGAGEDFIKWRDTAHFYWPIDYIEFLFRGGFDWYYFLRRKHVRRLCG